MIEEQDWMVLYRAAVAEADPRKLASRIAEAEQAIKQKLRQMMQEGTSTSDERKSLEDALHQLRLLRGENP